MARWPEKALCLLIGHVPYDATSLHPEWIYVFCSRCKDSLPGRRQ